MSDALRNRRARVFGLCAILIGVVLTTASSAQEMSTEEILRRFEIQQAAPSGGAARGLSLSYGDDDVLAADSVQLEAYRPVQDDARVDLKIYFEWNSASLKPEAVGQLSELCHAIQQVTGAQVFKIIGHTDKSGSDDYNLYLSQARAREVKRHLVDECAIPANSLLATGEGERQANPTAPERNPDERRVEVQLVG